MSTRSTEHRERVARQNAEYDLRKQYKLGLYMAEGLREPVLPSLQVKRSGRRRNNTAVVAALLAGSIGAAYHVKEN